MLAENKQQEKISIFKSFSDFQTQCSKILKKAQESEPKYHFPGQRWLPWGDVCNMSKSALEKLTQNCCNPENVLSSYYQTIAHSVEVLYSQKNDEKIVVAIGDKEKFYAAVLGIGDCLWFTIGDSFRSGIE